MIRVFAQDACAGDESLGELAPVILRHHIPEHRPALVDVDLAARLVVDDRAQVSFYEGCLSVPGLTGVVPRHRSVRGEALDEYGQPVDRVFSGWAARIVQHEVDHLRGRLYLDQVETRSLATTGNYARLWAGRPPEDAAASLRFTLR